MANPVTVRSVSTDQLKTLRSSAGAAGDVQQVILCNMALGHRIDFDDYALDSEERRNFQRRGWTKFRALKECVDVINLAQSNALSRGWADR